MKNKKSRKGIIEATKSALGFYVLSLLIIEAFISSILIFSNLESRYKLIGFLIGIGLFLLIVIIVAIFAWFKPHSLTYNEYAHLIDSGKVPWGTNLEEIPYSKLEKSESAKEEQ